MSESVMLVRYGEIFLKSSWVRKSFTDKLASNIKHRLSLNGVEASVAVIRHGLIVKTEEINPRILSETADVFGVKTVYHALEAKANMEVLKRECLELAGIHLEGGRSFAVRARRTKDFPATSMEIERKLGAEIQGSYGNPVDLENPDVTFHVQVINEYAYLSGEKVAGIGGLPYGTQGRLLASVKQSNDLYAVWLMMRRGARVDVHCRQELIGEAGELGKYADGEIKITAGKETKLKECMENRDYLGLVLGVQADEAVSFMNNHGIDYPVYLPLSGIPDSVENPLPERDYR